MCHIVAYGSESAVRQWLYKSTCRAITHATGQSYCTQPSSSVRVSLLAGHPCIYNVADRTYSPFRLVQNMMCIGLSKT
jgi:hypothetical protein